MKIPDIDPRALYTVEQAVKMLMEMNPHISYEDSRREVHKAIDSGKLPIAGYLVPPDA